MYIHYYYLYSLRFYTYLLRDFWILSLKKSLEIIRNLNSRSCFFTFKKLLTYLCNDVKNNNIVIYDCDTIRIVFVYRGVDTTEL